MPSLVLFYLPNTSAYYVSNNGQSGKNSGYLLTSKRACVILVTIFINAMKKLFFVHSFFQRADGWCKSVKTVKKVSFWSRTAESIKRLRLAPLSWQRAYRSLTELTVYR